MAARLTPPYDPTQAPAIVALALEIFLVDAARDIAGLNASLRENRPAIDWLRLAAPPLWQRVADHTRRRRAQLAA